MSELLKQILRKKGQSVPKSTKPKPPRPQAKLGKKRKPPYGGLKVPQIIPAMRAGKTNFRKSTNKSLPELAEKIFKRKKTSGLDNEMFKSAGDWVGTEEAFADAELDIPDYGDAWMKHGGSIKKKSNRAALRGGRKEVRGA
jgi:hypothetical protein